MILLFLAELLSFSVLSALFAPRLHQTSADRVRTLTIKAVPYPNYWKASRAHFEEVETLAIADVNARTTALQTGELDLMNRCELKTVHLLQQLPGLQVLQTTAARHYSLPMLTDLAPFDNNQVRLALKYGIDRPSVAQHDLAWLWAGRQRSPDWPVPAPFCS